MTIRRRIKQKWQYRLGDFEFKKATYHSDKSKSFEVWHKQNLLGYCKVERFRFGTTQFDTKKNLPSFVIHKKNPVTVLKIFEEEKEVHSSLYNATPATHIGEVYSTGSKNGFPKNIIYVEIFPEKLNFVAERYVMFEKKGNFHGVIFRSPGVYTIEND